MLTSDCQPRGQLEPDPGTDGCLLAMEFWKIGDSRRAVPHDPLTNPSSTDQAAAASAGHRLGYQHARRTHTIATFNLHHYVFSNNFQEALVRVRSAAVYEPARMLVNSAPAKGSAHDLMWN
jgi:hypothetical protein